MSLAEEEEVQIQDVFFAEDNQKENMMILDLRAPYSLVGEKWMRKYFEDNRIRITDLNKKDGRNKFRFGPRKVHESKVIYELPIVLKNSWDEEVFLEMEVYEVDAMA